jgi:hypothetical protein
VLVQQQPQLALVRQLDDAILGAFVPQDALSSAQDGILDAGQLLAGPAGGKLWREAR